MASDDWLVEETLQLATLERMLHTPRTNSRTLSDGATRHIVSNGEPCLPHEMNSKVNYRNGIILAREPSIAEIT